ncbi:LON peptidase substrate-binding domain-containing protein [Bradyrhizobium canariense]|uniref:ATP-dependent Lon protease n=1 Tax=Bradyrhizobium canariense TaxID=255045 RepID=A0A1H2ASA4_9BRAD|nr:LON peptidase substrate-binding domain-containing protein [Bradyrhizobium canariense]SDT48416.1 ATP-dependent Lon protease [Bradyrhizobium canariense]
MRDFRDAKAMAQTLREALKTKSVSLSHSESLELVAKTFGFPDWNFLAARIQASQPAFHSSVTPAPLNVLTPVSGGAGIPIVPMRDLVLFPQMVAPIFVGRDKTRRAIARAISTDSRVLVVTQRRAADDDPTLDALYSVGVMASVIHRATLLDGTLKLFVSGLERTAIIGPVEEEFLAAEVAPFEETRGHTAEAEALFLAVLDAYQIWANLDLSAMPQGPQARLQLPSIGEPGGLADAVAPLLSIGIDRKQQLLETGDVVARLEAILELMKASQHAA